MYMPSGNHYYLNTPVVILNGIQLAFVRSYKYLGTDNADDANMRRQRGIYAMLGPMALLRIFQCAPLW